MFARVNRWLTTLTLCTQWLAYDQSKLASQVWSFCSREMHGLLSQKNLAHDTGGQRKYSKASVACVEESQEHGEGSLQYYTPVCLHLEHGPWAR